MSYMFLDLWGAKIALQGGGPIKYGRMAPFNGFPKGTKVDLLGHKRTYRPKWLPSLYQTAPLILWVYRKFSIKGALFMTPNFMGFWTFLAISQLKMVRFSFSKKPLEDENAPYLMRTPGLRACLRARCLYWGIYGIFTFEMWPLVAELKLKVSTPPKERTPAIACYSGITACDCDDVVMMLHYVRHPRKILGIWMTLKTAPT